MVAAVETDVFPNSLVLQDGKIGSIENRGWVHCLWSVVNLSGYSVSCAITSGCGSTASFHNGLVDSERDNHLGKTLALDDNQLDSHFQRIFGPKTLDYFQKSVVWQSYRGSLLVWDNLNIQDPSDSSACLRGEPRRETVQHAIVQCSRVSEMWLMQNTRCQI